MKLKFLSIFIPFLLIISGILFYCYSIYYEQPPINTGESRIIDIPHGATLQKIAQILLKEGLIKDSNRFIYYARFKGYDKKLQSGKYQIKVGATKDEILKKLTTGDILTQKVTIPEGATLKKIASIFEKELSIDKNEFIRLATDTAFIHKLGLNTTSLEGYLFPETYTLWVGISCEDILESMVQMFNRFYTDEYKRRADSLHFTTHQVVTLASIIEAETKVANERPIVSSVFHNRLRIGMALQSCATVNYLLPEPKERLLLKDLEIKSPYNTYLHTGLPPGPIGNPGKASIESALYPKKTDYLFFVSNGDGTHTFTKTQWEHGVAHQRLKEKTNKNK